MPVKKKRGRPRQNGKHGKGRNMKDIRQKIKDIAAAIPHSHGNFLAISKIVGLERHIVSKIIHENPQLLKAYEESQIDTGFEYQKRIYDWIMAGKDPQGNVLPPNTGQVRLMQLYIESHPNLFPDWKKKEEEPISVEVNLEMIARALEKQTEDNS